MPIDLIMAMSLRNMNSEKLEMVQVDWLEPWYEDYDENLNPSGSVQALRNNENSTYVEYVNTKKIFFSVLQFNKQTLKEKI